VHFPFIQEVLLGKFGTTSNQRHSLLHAAPDLIARDVDDRRLFNGHDVERSEEMLFISANLLGKFAIAKRLTGVRKPKLGETVELPGLPREIDTSLHPVYNVVLSVLTEAGCILHKRTMVVEPMLLEMLDGPIRLP
jgi:hypothetical protein